MKNDDSIEYNGDTIEYIYIYMYIYVYLYMYIYIYIDTYI